MNKLYKLHLQVADGHLRLVPRGPMSEAGVEQLLGVARSALTFFPMLTVDLRGAWEMREVHLARLEEGLRQLIAEKKLTLTSEKPHLRWQVHPPSNSHADCTCGGLCQDCPHRSAGSARTRRQDPRSSGDQGW